MVFLPEVITGIDHTDLTATDLVVGVDVNTPPGWSGDFGQVVIRDLDQQIIDGGRAAEDPENSMGLNVIGHGDTVTIQRHLHRVRHAFNYPVEVTFPGCRQAVWVAARLFAGAVENCAPRQRRRESFPQFPSALSDTGETIALWRWIQSGERSSS
ncbi:hypothetical protein KV112_08875 [Mycolicibacter sp. MYC123]|uniref:Uncharacterized protein n=1 Tax=[Mycobacterium] zoologicum TaxID=2872311 RepID=A0ABU5YIH5_9MYCO|nr:MULTISPECIES: hypothetical protein [unclassified Mycolicibacter]MEB3049846.1 hypothetical protein [Mycolicibacter sp. MYC123]MEB3065759.1 hypothetical protein [Mycolicibacter sp. MYC101]